MLELQNYSNLPLSFQINKGQLEYDYVISPGADPKLITLVIEGVNKLDVNENRDLVLESGKSQLHFKKPCIYQEINGIRKEISLVASINP